MYYSFTCTNCGRLFYTFDRNKEHASDTLYSAVKQHLIDYNEDQKEYEMDDGEEADSDQIYEEMRESSHPPAGGYEAKRGHISADSSYTHSHSSNILLFFLVVLIIGLLVLFFFYPQIQNQVRINNLIK